MVRRFRGPHKKLGHTKFSRAGGGNTMTTDASFVDCAAYFL